MSISPTTDSTAYIGTTNQPNGDPNTTDPYNIYDTQQAVNSMNRSTSEMFSNSTSADGQQSIHNAITEDDPDAPPTLVNIE